MSTSAMSTPRPTAKAPSSPADQADEQFNLPDFVWSCGNSEVMAYVQRLMAESLDLKQQLRDASQNAAPGQVVAMDTPPKEACPKEPFDTHREISAEQAVAFAKT